MSAEDRRGILRPLQPVADSKKGGQGDRSSHCLETWHKILKYVKNWTQRWLSKFLRVPPQSAVFRGRSPQQ